MSHAVMRGSPTKAQLYLDAILEELVAETGRQEDRYSLAKIFFKCFRDHPQDIRQIEGSTGAEYTNEEVLRRSVRGALALQAAGVKPGQTVLLLGRNHIELTAAYFGTLFSGNLLFPLHVGMTVYELVHFLRISEPVVIFAEVESLQNIEQALNECGRTAQIIVFGRRFGTYNIFSQFTSGFDDLVKNFRPIDSNKDSPVMLMSTSGSTGFPKAIVLTNRGLVAQLPSIWESHDTFPEPTSLFMNCSTAGWLAHTIVMQCTAAYRVSMLTTANDGGLHAIRKLIRKYRPSCTLMPTYVAAFLLQEPDYLPGDLSCFDVIFISGSAMSDTLLGNLRRALQPASSVVIGYGMTEAYGIYVLQRLGTTKNSVGFALNTTMIKIVDEEGNVMDPNVAGELYCKSKDCMFMGYYRDEAATKKMLTEDGWLKTGDMLCMDELGELYFVERIKFLIRSGSSAEAYNVYPTEVEHVISQLEGVAAVAVCGAERGPAALVVPRPGSSLTPQQVHDAVNSALSDMKRLRGGVAFVTSLPLLPSRKIDRKKLKTIFLEINEREPKLQLYLKYWLCLLSECLGLCAGRNVPRTCDHRNIHLRDCPMLTSLYIAKGYYRDEAATKEIFTEDGWFRTGDMVYMDEQEEIFFIERIKFLIRSDATSAHVYNVCPSEVEQVISKLEGVKDVAVYGAERGPAAVVVPRPGSSLTPQQVHNAVNSALSDMKRLRGGVIFIPSIPTLFNRKVDRKKLTCIVKDIADEEIHYSDTI